ncbi:PA0069 family radical SAM protein [Yunchengibacter salinarum]|uniref:PA0069 family radical SAM protein n=1 Tax=Yunchengibacter salinarum TaxID=3133399 RepID=UPI0035B5DF7F
MNMSHDNRTGAYGGASTGAGGDAHRDAHGSAPATGLVRKGMGAVGNPAGRYERFETLLVDDGWNGLAAEAESRPRREITPETPRHALMRNRSPDIPFDRSINPYRGCEHGCIYCFARPTHAYQGLSPGQDFERRITIKPGLAERLGHDLARKNYQVKPIAIGTNTDPYQPVEKETQTTRQILETLNRHNHPVTLLTKSRLILRDRDILADMARRNLVKVSLSLTTLDHKLSATLEPRATTPTRRLDAMRVLADMGVPVGVMVAPVIPGLNDHLLEELLQAAARSGAREAGFIPLRLPGEVAPLFEEWLRTHFPHRAGKVLSGVRALHGGALNDPGFHDRFRAQGMEGALLRQRFHMAARAVGLNRQAPIRLDCSAFTPPNRAALKDAARGQYSLFDPA